MSKVQYHVLTNSTTVSGDEIGCCTAYKSCAHFYVIQARFVQLEIWRLIVSIKMKNLK